MNDETCVSFEYIYIFIGGTEYYYVFIVKAIFYKYIFMN